MMRRAREILVLLSALASAVAFGGVNPPSSRFARISRGLPRLFDNKEEEIAKLEEKLRRLKEEKEAEAAGSKTATAKDEEEVSLEMFLTEQWKEQEAAKADGSSSGGDFTTILYAVGTILALVAFSQIPIGQEDLSKYSVGNSPVAEQIDLGDLNRARRSGDL